MGLQPKLVTQHELANILGITPGAVSQYRAQGRLVHVGKLVDAEASRKLIESTALPGSRKRAKVSQLPQAEQPSGSTHSPDTDRRLQVADSVLGSRAVKEKFQALQAKADYEKFIGELVPASSLTAMADDIGALVRTSLENMADKFTHEVLSADTPEEAHALLSRIAIEISDDIAIAVAEHVGHKP